jgi:rubrerythrin
VAQPLTGKESLEEILQIALNAEKNSVCFYIGLKNLSPSDAGKEQVEEEANVDEVLQQLELAQESKGALFMLDKDMATRTFTPPTAEGGA